MRVLQELYSRKMQAAGDEGGEAGATPAGEGTSSFDAYLDAVVSGDVNGDDMGEVSTDAAAPVGGEPSDAAPAVDATPAPAPATPPTTDGVTPPVVPPTTPAQQTPSPAAQPKTEPATPTDVPDPAPATPEPPVMTPEQVQAQRAEVMKQLTTRYAIPEDVAPRLVTEPEKVIPELLANAHAQIMDTVQAYIEGAFPHMLQRHQTTQQRVTSNVDKFYSAWPELKDEKFGPTVARIVGGYRQANPNAKMEDVIQEGGLAALLALRLPIPERVLKMHNAGSSNAAPGSPPPALGGSAPSSGPVPGGNSGNVFEVVATEDVLGEGYTPPRGKTH